MHLTDRLRFDRPLPRYLLAFGAVAAATVGIALLGPLHLANASLLYLGAVLVIAVVAGRGPAIAASIAAFLTFDFFFTQPRFTFTVRDPSEWVALLTFLLVATVTGQLAATQRGRVEDAEAREREASLLHDISGLLGARPYKEALDAVAGRLRSELGLEAVAIELVDIGSTIPRVAAGDAAAVRTAREASGSMTVLGASEAADPRHPSEPGRWLRVTPPHRPGRRSVARGMIRIPIRGQGPALIGDLILLAGRERGPLGPRDLDCWPPRPPSLPLPSSRSGSGERRPKLRCCVAQTG